MNQIVIYTTNRCVYCDRAKEVFNSKKLKYIEYNISNNRGLFDEMLMKSNGKKTMPQIFINNIHIGGFNELKNLIEVGKFDKIINCK